jgi:hypothetical protein
MEYTQKTPNNLSKYVDDFHISVKKEFETALTNIYTSEINKYSDIIEHIVKLPFVKAIVDENIRLKEDILILHEISRKHENQLDHKQVVLEISDKPIEQAYQNMDDVVLNHGSDDEDSDDEDSDDEDSGGEDGHGDVIDKSLCVESNLNNQPTFPKPIIEEIQTQQVEQSSHEELEEEAEEEQSADEEEEVEQSADEEEVDEGEHVKQSVDKEEVEQSADEEEEEQEVTELEIDGKTYYCDGDENGNIYEDDDGDVGNIVGELKDGEAIFH